MHPARCRGRCLSVRGLPPVGALICYEAVFPTAIVQGEQRPGLLINVTNDGWFGDTTGPWQHFHQTRVRAVEEGLPIIRSANNGVSAIVDGQGRVVAMLNLNARGVIDSQIPASIAATVYATAGDSTFVVLALIFLATAVVLSAPRPGLETIWMLFQRDAAVIKQRWRSR